MLLSKNVIVSSIAVAIALTAIPLTASATVIDPSLSIVGTITLDDGDSDLQADNSYNTNMYSTVGGVTGGSILNQSLTDTGDGFGHTASLSGNSTSLTTLGADYEITATNNSADTYNLTFGITFAHSADADAGDLDARAVSELEVEDTAGMEFLFSRLTSESGADYGASNATWQDQIHDEVSDTYLGTWGELLSFGETRYFDIELIAGATFDLFALFDLDGRTWDDGASYNMSSSMFIFLDDFENLATGPEGDVPEPGTLALLMTGLIAVRLGRKYT